MAIDVGAVKKLSEAVEAVSKFAASAAGDSESGDKTGSSAVPGDSPAITMARKAKENYQKTARWMLAAFATVGVVIFGSLPFAAIADVELAWPASLWLIGGLVLAVAGIVGAVVAVSQVSEPEDMSLGELDREMRSVQRVKDNKFEFDKKTKRPVFTSGKLGAWWNPRLAARRELAEILHGPESGAHLGPGLTKEDNERPTVGHLITKLGSLETAHAEHAPVVARQAVAVETLEKRAEELTKLLEELRKRRSELPDPAPEVDKVAVDRRIRAASDAFSGVSVALGNARRNLVRENEKLAGVNNSLELYHAHRGLVLAESGILQLRGTFRLARRILAVAAVLTLFGGTAYALSLPSSDDDEVKAANPTTPPPPAHAPSLPATVVVHAGTKPAGELPRDCLDRELAAVWVGDSAIPSLVGPYTVVVTDPACPGRVTVGKGEGRFQLTR